MSTLLGNIDKLYSICDESHIKVDFYNLPANLLGHYYKSDGSYPCISMDYSIKNDYASTLEVFSEEVGHHQTSYGMSYIIQGNRLGCNPVLGKIERRACVRGCEILISIEDLFRALDNGHNSLCEACDILGVTWNMLNLRLEELSRKHSSIDFEGKSLVLSNYPRLSFVEVF
ncbi:MAG: hypothetical protein ACRCX2_00670 [Paraclostridium sp.]